MGDDFPVITAKKSSDIVYYDGHVLGPWLTCPGTVEIWDQTIGCPECMEELWTGRTREDDFHARHPFILDDCHDDGDAHWADDAFNPDIPLGGWRFPSFPPAWHDVGHSWPRWSPDEHRRVTEHAPRAVDRSAHDAGDEDGEAW